MYQSSIIESKPGVFSIVGSVPMSLCFERHDGQPLTDKDIETIRHCGPGFAKKTVKNRIFESRLDAEQAIADTNNL